MITLRLSGLARLQVKFVLPGKAQFLIRVIGSVTNFRGFARPVFGSGHPVFAPGIFLSNVRYLLRFTARFGALSAVCPIKIHGIGRALRRLLWALRMMWRLVAPGGSTFPGRRRGVCMAPVRVVFAFAERSRGRDVSEGAA